MTNNSYNFFEPASGSPSFPIFKPMMIEEKKPTHINQESTDWGVFSESLQWMKVIEYGFLLDTNKVSCINTQLPLSKKNFSQESRKARYKKASALLQKWMTEKSKYDETIWPDLKEALINSTTRCSE